LTRKKVVVLTNIISPYVIPRFNKVAEAEVFDFDVFFMAETESNRLWKVYKEKIKFNYIKLKGFHFFLGRQRPIHLNFGITSHLLKMKYDLLVIGPYYQPAALQALFLSKLLKTKTMLWIDGSIYYKKQENWLLKKLKRLIIRNYSSFIVSGKAAFNYIEDLGGDSQRIFVAPFPAEHDYFHKEFLRLRPYKQEIKTKKNYPPIVILYSGRFIPIKGVLILLQAYAKLQRQIKDIGLVLLGNGPEREKYESYCQTNRIDNIYFEGFVQKDGLPEFYTAADIFVLPSLSDSWGLVINEAMAFGLPVISTDAAGATYDLVKDGVNGFVISAGDADSLYAALKRLCEEPKLRIKMGQESLKIIENYTPEKWAKAFINAVKSMLRI